MQTLRNNEQSRRILYTIYNTHNPRRMLVSMRITHIDGHMTYTDVKQLIAELQHIEEQMAEILATHAENTPPDK
ncbi:MAG: hypothetical protein DDT38_01133 [Firmicutes bacterium]|nr:hypothetical protein [candidate division NPL-UPA2 bacterium]